MNISISRTRGAGLAGLVGAAAVVTGAGGAFGSPSGGATQILTTNPDLVSATVVRGYNPAPGAATARISACYDKQLGGAVAARFTLEGYGQRPSPVPASAASVDPSNRSCVLVDYPATTDVAHNTILEDTGGGASTAASLASTAGSAALSGSTQTARLGGTSGPDLVGIPALSIADKSLTFTFDAILSPTLAASPADFATYDVSGKRLAAPTKVTVNGDTAVATYASVTGAFAPVRFAVLPGAVRSVTSMERNPLGSGGVSTHAPALISATPVGANQYLLAYSLPVNATSADVVGSASTGVKAYTADGSAIPATALASGAGTATLLVTFGEVTKFDEKVVGIADLSASVKDLPSATPSVPSFVAVRAANAVAGFADGPDLHQAVVNATRNSVTYSFDENVSDTTAPAAGRFQLLDANGVASAGSSATVIGKDVTVQYTAAQLATAKGARVLEDAACDFQGSAGHCSPLSSVALGAAGTIPVPVPVPSPKPAPKPAPKPMPAPKPAPKPAPAGRLRAKKLSAFGRRRGTRTFLIRGSLTFFKAYTPAQKRLLCGTKGLVSVQVKAGGRTLSTRRVRLKPTCAYQATVSFGSTTRFGTAKALRFVVRFGGNRYVAARSAKAVTIRRA